MNVWSRINPGEFIGLVAVAGGLLCGLAAIIMGCWVHLRRAELDAALKQDMLNRGMSADDIRTVLEANSAAEREASGRHA